MGSELSTRLNNRMNPEHTAKTLQALNSTISLLENAISEFKERRAVFDELLAPPGVTYYRRSDPIMPAEVGLEEIVAGFEVVHYWLIVSSSRIRTPILHEGYRYYCMHDEGPPPDAENIERVKVSGVTTAWGGDDFETLEYFLLVEEIPEKP